MDWTDIIELHRAALMRIVARLAAMTGGEQTLPRHFHRTILRLLRPAESAARRLDVLVALRLPMPELPRYRPSKPKPALPPKPRGKPINLGIALPVAAPHNADGGGAAPATPSPLRGSEGRVRPVAHPIQGGGGYVCAALGEGGADAGVATGDAGATVDERGDTAVSEGGTANEDNVSRPPPFQIVDPLRRYMLRRRWVRRTGVPRISRPGITVPFPAKLLPPPKASDDLDATCLVRRLAALAAALNDLPKQARRFLLWQARNRRERAKNIVRRVAPLRAGRPPGQRRRHRHEVHDLLEQLQEEAFYALEEQHDTS